MIAWAAEAAWAARSRSQAIAGDGLVNTIDGMLATALNGEICYRSPWGQGCLLGAGTVSKAAGWDGQGWRCDHYSAVLCMSGTAEYRNEGGCFPVGPGQLFQRHPGHPHSLQILSPGWRECWIALGRDLWLPLISTRTVHPEQGAVTLSRPDLWATAVETACHDLEQAQDRALPGFIPRLLGLVIQALIPPLDTRQGSVIERACEAMRIDPRCDLHGFAAAEGIPFDRFRKLFRAQVGVSPGRYLIQRRIDRARILLGDRTQTVTSIAAALGYPDVFTFSTQFRKETGSSPMDWRRGSRSG